MVVKAGSVQTKGDGFAVRDIQLCLLELMVQGCRGVQGKE